MGIPNSMADAVMIPYCRTVPPKDVKYTGKKASATFPAALIELEIINMAMFPFGMMSFKLIFSGKNFFILF